MPATPAPIDPASVEPDNVDAGLIVLVGAFSAVALLLIVLLLQAWFYTWKAEGKMPPNVRLELPSPGLPGQPMYYAIPAKAANAQLAKKFVEFAESPEVQADGIVKQFNWYPGIDPQHVQGKLDQAAWNKLFTDISPSQLSQYGRPFPLSDYFTDIVEGYERVVIK